ncbi:MAG: acylphosphatase [Gemmatimonadales bacterium]
MTRGFLVSGAVQGVGYRFFARRTALRLGVTGWVRNLPDGRVECLAVGTAEAVAAFAAELRRGPPFARVDRVDEVEKQDSVEALKAFDIR